MRCDTPHSHVVIARAAVSRRSLGSRGVENFADAWAPRTRPWISAAAVRAAGGGHPEGVRHGGRRVRRRLPDSCGAGCAPAAHAAGPCAHAAAPGTGRQSKISPIPPVAPESIAAARRPGEPWGEPEAIDLDGAMGATFSFTCVCAHATDAARRHPRASLPRSRWRCRRPAPNPRRAPAVPEVSARTFAHRAAATPPALRFVLLLEAYLRRCAGLCTRRRKVGRVSLFHATGVCLLVFIPQIFLLNVRVKTAPRYCTKRLRCLKSLLFVFS